MKQLVTWFKSKEDAVKARHELHISGHSSGFTIDENACENGIIKSDVFRFTKGEIHRWIMGGVGGFILGMVFGILLIENIIVIPRLAPLFSMDSSAVVFILGLVGSALVGTIVSIISMNTKKILKRKEKKTKELQNNIIEKNENNVTEREYGLILDNVKAHQLQIIRQILHKNNVTKINEVMLEY